MQLSHFWRIIEKQKRLVSKLNKRITFDAHGKLLLTGEYLVLDGADALAAPTHYGQQMHIATGRGSDIKWTSKDDKGEVWFKATISLFDFACEKSTDEVIGRRLTSMLTEAVRLNSDFLSKWKSYKVETNVDFPLDWGLGTSSSLIYCLAQWADVDPYELQARTIGGSGYDIACADAAKPIIYRRNDSKPDVKEVDLSNVWHKNAFFVHLNKKQNTSEALLHFEEKRSKIKSSTITEISQIGQTIGSAKKLDELNELIANHERIISEILNMPTVKSTHFSDFEGEVKSLGAWGGDFVMATTKMNKKEAQAYFNNKGFKTLLSWDEMMNF